jgi:hypothetical protein
LRTTLNPDGREADHIVHAQAEPKVLHMQAFHQRSVVQGITQRYRRDRKKIIFIKKAGGITKPI